MVLLLLPACFPPPDHDLRIDAVTAEFYTTSNFPEDLLWEVSPGTGPFWVHFEGIPDDQALWAGAFTVSSGHPYFTFGAPSGLAGGPETGYAFTAPLTVDVPAFDPQVDTDFLPVVLEPEFVPTGEGTAKTPDYLVSIPYIPQVDAHLQMQMTTYDAQHMDSRPGVTVFSPAMQLAEPYPAVFPDGRIPAGRFGYVTTFGGAVAVLDTSPANPGADEDSTGGPESFQQPAYVDVAVLARGSSTLNLFKGNETATFQARKVRSTSAGYLAQALSAADYDLDGAIDLAVAEQHATSPGGNGRVLLFQGEGYTDSYNDTQVVAIPDSDYPRAIAWGDVNGDGFPDLIVADGDPSDSHNVSILMNQYTAGCEVSSQCFASAVALDTGGGDLRAIVTGGFESSEDPTLDLVLAAYDENRIKVLKGDGQGGFSGPYHVNVGAGPVAMAAGRFNPDHPVGLVTANAADRSLTILRGDYTQEELFTVAHTIDLEDQSPGAPRPVAVVTGYFDGDNFADLAVVLNDEGTTPEDPDKLVIYLGNGDYTFAHHSTIDLPVNCNPTDLVAGNFNNDMQLDLALTCAGVSGNPFTPKQVRVYRGNRDGMGNFTGFSYVFPSAATDLDPVAMVVTKFDNQYQDFLYLPEGRNAGYGAAFWSYPLDGAGEPTAQTRHFLFVSNHTLDGVDHAGDFLDACRIDDDYIPDPEDPGHVRIVGNTVSVYEINPRFFPPTRERPGNDRLVATLQVGCGPQGMVQVSKEHGGVEYHYLYVNNAHSGTLTPIDLEEFYDRVTNPQYPIEDPKVPEDQDIGIGLPITVGPSLFFVDPPELVPPPPPYAQPINRSVVYGEWRGGLWRLFVTISGYCDDRQGLCNENYRGSIAVVDIDPRDDVDTDALGTHHYLWPILGHDGPEGEVWLGKFTVGIVGIPDQFRWLLINNGGPPSENNWNTLTFFAIDFDAQGVPDFEFEPLDYPLGDAPGKVTGSVALSADAKRAYLPRTSSNPAGDPYTGLVVFDMGRKIPPDKRLMGAVGQVEGVAHVAAFSDPVRGVSKLYQSNVDATSNLRGVWVMPEPLAAPYHPVRLVQALVDLDPDPQYKPYPFPQRKYALMGPHVRRDGAKLLVSRFDDLTGDGEVDFVSSEIVTMDLDLNDTVFTGKGEVNLTNNTDFDNPAESIIDATPAWSPGPVGGTWKIVFSSDRHCKEEEPPCHADLYVMDEDGENVTRLTQTPGYNEYDVHWGEKASDGSWWIVFKTDPVDCDVYTENCISQLWRAEYDKTTNQLVPGSRQVLTDFVSYWPTYVSQHYTGQDPPGYQNAGEGFFGDYDPKIDPTGQYVVFGRFMEECAGGAQPDVDLFIIPLDGQPGDEFQVSGHCDGICFDGAEPNPDLCPDERDDHIYRDVIPAWSPDPAAPMISFATRSETDKKQNYDIMLLTDPFAEAGDRGRTNLFEGQDPEEDNNLDSAASWFPNALNGDPSTPDIIFDRRAWAPPRDDLRRMFKNY